MLTSLKAAIVGERLRTHSAPSSRPDKTSFTRPLPRERESDTLEQDFQVRWDGAPPPAIVVARVCLSVGVSSPQDALLGLSRVSSL